MNRTRIYFVCPTWDHPPNEAIFLGSLITDPLDPESSLNATDKPNLPEGLIQKTHKAEWNSDEHKGSAMKLGVWTKFLQKIGIGANFGLTGGSADETGIKVKRLETEIIAPSTSLVSEILQTAPEAMDFIKASNFKDPVYMVTGVKIARGAQLQTGKQMSRSLESSVGVDTTGISVPVAVGPQLELGSGRSQVTSFTDSSDFVFAYRLNKVIYSKNAESVLHQRYTKGAMLGGSFVDAEDGKNALIVDGLEEEETAQHFKDGNTAAEDVPDSL